MEEKSVRVIEKISADNKLGERDARELIRGASKIYIARGKSLEEFPGGTATKELVEKMLGSTGNLRAPTIRVGKTLLVGFNEETYLRVFG
jgi:arsenate reductase-like glutaredoxin family protein